jgi:excisionase family DNA binding protein
VEPWNLRGEVERMPTLGAVRRWHVRRNGVAVADFLTIDEAAEHVRVSPKTIQRAMRDRRNPLRHYRPGRRVVIARADLEAWLKLHVAMPAPSPTVLDRVSPLARSVLADLAATPAQPRGETHCRTSIDPLTPTQRQPTSGA